MKTRWYFIIASVAVAGFAVWYQDYHRDYSHRRDALAAERALQRAAEIEQQRIAHEQAIGEARQNLEVRNAERAERALRDAWEQERRDAWQSQLVAAREEIAALRSSRERLVRELDELDRHLARQKHEHAAIASEDQFLQDYIAAALASRDRLEAVATKAATLRVTAAADSVPAPHTR